MHDRMMRVAITALALVTIAVPASALAFADGGGSHAVGARVAGTHTVLLKGLRFRPSAVSIRRGESVMWVWSDRNIEHNVTASSFRSHTQKHGSFTVRFTHAGTFNYHCTIHASEGMVGKVIVH